MKTTNHVLESERGRYINIKKEERICKDLHSANP
jgi:hypothetical protein